jgi:hypothetical protein
MAEITRICKSGSKWTKNDLKAFNINVLKKSEKDFFGFSVDNVSLDDVPDGFINLEYPSIDDMESYKILRYLDMAMFAAESEESAVDDFSHELLGILRFENPGQVIRMRKSIRLFTCGKYTHAKTDLCIIGEQGILLLIQEDKSYIKFSDPEPQIIAEAIAAFQYNNDIRVEQLDLEDLQEYTFPCITMVGTYPVFYKIKVTKELDEAVRLGRYPKCETLVEKFNPVGDQGGYNYGMKPLGNRKRILQSFIGFRKVYNNTLLSS